MRYLPHTDEDIRTMFDTIGVSDFEGLFRTVPESCRYDKEMKLPPPKTEWDLNSYMAEIKSMMKITPEHAVLVGAGRYQHHIPSTIPAIMSRSELITAYTPYQPEMAQGTLQGLYEYQTLTARLLGVDVANASMYDGASALAEALLMGIRIGRKKKRVAVSKAIHPHYRAVVDTYFAPTEYEIVELAVAEDGRTDLSSLSAEDGFAAVALQSPNFFGVIEDMEKSAEAIHAADSLFIAAFSEPLAFGLVKSPGSCGADIVCGEGQSLGIPVSFGGPGLGMFGCRDKFVRNLPGRLVGETRDLEGKRGYVLTLSTREQHIRREKATSNICSNQGICTLTAAMYMASLGGTGIRKLAKLNFDKAEYLKAGLQQAGATLCHDAPTFNEFAVRFDSDFKPVQKSLMEQGIAAGLNLSGFYDDMDNCYLFCVTETASKDVLDTVIKEVKK
ncbi:aminomethyl-transferring glycine dehydrogenase subunit GcvPA [Desulforhopalus singaporensis]|uniref:Probable glycine dehydrogenase (decarboxylating) subunit 1 n=1 Tax=Desulforhopalus singaporensis TaxID=91360 RepID=A0A1H0PT39_9BACT|nr:aminomethyl-transferring glycine dehydrogenase subunit GcvPA [Desulforhopalus singaporensis]SDP08164.1 glycine dehydrogenase (decarboxylating) alpha subunit [Desulforhopalus singaporensis]